MSETINYFFNHIPLILNGLFFLGGLFILIKGSDLFIEAAVYFARRFHISEMIIGLTLVSIGTSLPELATNINAALKGRTTIAIGNIIGSNITNISLVLGTSLLIIGTVTFEKKLLTRDALMMLGTTVLFLFFCYFFDQNNYQINRIEGILMLCLLAIYLYYLFKSHQLGDESHQDQKIKYLWYAVLLLLLGSIGIFIGSEIMIRNIIVIAKKFHISDGVIGATIVALGTSLPELSVTIMGIVKKRSDLSLGNIIGSNIFNILGILGITALIKDLQIFDIINHKTDQTTLYFTLPFVLMISCLLIIFMRTGWKMTRKEGIIFLLFYIAFIFFNFYGVPYLK